MNLMPAPDANCVRCASVLPVDVFIAGGTTCPACVTDTDEEEAD